jgi:phosphate-selective porin OprO and OprP
VNQLNNLAACPRIAETPSFPRVKTLVAALGLVLLHATLPNAWADSDTDARIAQLQRMLEVQQQQMQLLANELKALKEATIKPAESVDPAKSPHLIAAEEKQQLREQQAKIDTMAEQLKSLQAARGQSTGQPVYANFKNGLSFEDGTGNWKLGINGRVQADYRSFSPDIAAADTFNIRRGRLGANVAMKDFAARLEAEYSGTANNGSVGLTYAHVDYIHFNSFKLRVGQFKPFYGLERAMNANFTDFQERGSTDYLLGATFDRGVMVFGEPVPGLFYNASWTDGKGVNTASANGDETDAKYDNKDTLVRVVGNIAQFANWKDSVVHVGGFYAKGQQEPGSNPTLAVLTEGRGYTMFSTAEGFTRAVDRTRQGYELALAHGPVKLQTEHIRENFDGENVDRDLTAWYASVSWLVTGEAFASTYKDGMFGRLRPKHDFVWGGDGWGALQLGARYSKFDGSDFVTTNPTGTGRLAAGRTNQFNAWTLGANWILTPYVRLVANYVHTHFDTPVTTTATVSGGPKSYTLDHEDAITMRAQFDF